MRPTVLLTMLYITSPRLIYLVPGSLYLPTTMFQYEITESVLGIFLVQRICTQHYMYNSRSHVIRLCI